MESPPGGPYRNRRIAAAVSHTIALRSDGAVWTWGSNYSGQIGNGEQGDYGVSMPYHVELPTKAIAVSAGLDNNAALLVDGTIMVWGTNDDGRLGLDGVNHAHTPVAIPDLPRMVDIACGSTFMLALDEKGQVWSWGGNFSGTLGDGRQGKNQWRTTPQPIRDLPPIKQIDAGEDYCLALDRDNVVWGWGSDEVGQLALREPISDHFTENTFGPNQTGEYLELAARWCHPSPEKLPGLKNIVTVSAGVDHALYIDQTSSLWVCGANAWGQLGLGSRDTVTAPAKIPNLENVIGACGGELHTLAASRDGSVWAWGSNRYGELGHATEAQRIPYPLLVDRIEGAIAVAAGSHYSLALTADDQLYSWGRNHRGQLGDGTLVDRAAPVRVH